MRPCMDFDFSIGLRSCVDLCTSYVKLSLVNQDGDNYNTHIIVIQLFQNRLSWSVVDTGTERNFGYSHNE